MSNSMVGIVVANMFAKIRTIDNVLDLYDKMPWSHLIQWLNELMKINGFIEEY